jgi:ABC-type branched-subunit amino acid transport system substrate-binding protein
VARALDLCSTLPVIKIGLVAPFEGRYRTLGYEALYAVKLAVRERNAAGGVDGYMVELVALDDGEDAESRRFLAHKFAVDERVVGVIGPFSGDSLYAAASTYEELGLPLITPATCLPAGSAQMGEAFCLGASVEGLADALAGAMDAGAQVAVVRGLSVEAMNSEAPSWADYLPEGRWEVRAAADWREAPADAYLFDGDVLAAVELLIDLRDAGVHASLIGGPMLARTQLAQIAGKAVAHACHAMPDSTYAQRGEAFAAQYQELGGGVPGPWAALAYDAAVLLLDGLEAEIERSGQPTRAGVGAALVELRGPDGDLVFVDHRRRQVEVSLYCYQAGDVYPGSIVR